MNPDDPNDQDPENKNEGEGSRTAARRYNADVRAFVAGDHVTGAARDAVRATEGPEGAADAAARAQAAHRGRPTLRDRIKGLYHRVLNMIPRRKSAARPM